MHENVSKHHNFCYTIPEESKNILKYNQDKNSLKTPFVIYVDTELLLQKHKEMW